MLILILALFACSVQAGYIGRLTIVPGPFTFKTTGGATLFSIAPTSGNTAIKGNLAINSNKFNVTASNGNTTVAGTLGVTGAATYSSTLGVTGNLAVNTNKFVVTGASGNTAISGDLAVATNKFTVAAASGNTAVAGTLGVTGSATYSSTVTGPGGGLGVYSARVVAAVGSDANQLNNASGTTLLPAVAGRKYRLISYIAVADANVTGATGIYIQGTQGASAVNLSTITAGALAANATNTIGTANNTLLNNCASFAACDANTAITAIKNGSDIATATTITFIITYAVE